MFKPVDQFVSDEEKMSAVISLVAVRQLQSLCERSNFCDWQAEQLRRARRVEFVGVQVEVGSNMRQRVHRYDSVSATACERCQAAWRVMLVISPICGRVAASACAVATWNVLTLTIRVGGIVELR